ncbi:MAG: hypothetical protein SGJ03_10455 [Alphaproteobacteria bacterium]|nr:hypothetical protein [Alphaproteobacteria bacterium]
MRFVVIAVSLAVMLNQLAWAGDANLSGHWAGEMRQVDPDQESRYSMALSLKGSGGTTSYPSLNCGGSLEKIGDAAGGYVIFREKITYGALNSDVERGCINGLLIITQRDGKLVLGWFAAFDGLPALASAVLEKEMVQSK